MGWCCTHVPVEIIHSSGLLPRRLLPPYPEKEGILPDPNFCPFVRAVMAQAEGISQVLVLSNSCDGMRRLYDALKEFCPLLHVFLLDVPRKLTPRAVEYYADVLRDFSAWLGAFGSKPSLDDVRNSIRLFNRKRAKFLEVLKWGRASDLLFLLKDGFPPDENLLLQVGRRKPGKVRILVTGSLLEMHHLVRFVEDLGGEVVFPDTCSGVRGPYHVDEEGDPFLSLSRAYLGKPPCARMETPSRMEHVSSLLDDVQGVIFYLPKFCDLYCYELLGLRSLCQERKVPLLQIEGDYSLRLSEGMKTRIQAFLERWI